ncbi:MAG: hypothetical protein ACXVJA_19450, partial [Acidimicrobiia bacterium]
MPGTFAPDAEIAALLEVMAAEGLGALQLVPAGSSGTIGLDPAGAMEAEVDWMVRWGEEYRRPITFLILEHGPDFGVWRGSFDRVREANARGADIHPQVASRCFGMLFGHQSRMNPFKYRRSYQEVADRPFAARTRSNQPRHTPNSGPCSRMRKVIGRRYSSPQRTIQSTSA